jgi:uncharacterized protein YciI
MFAMKHYCYIMREAKPGLLDSPKPEEAAIISEHLSFLQEYMEAGILMLAGNYKDEIASIVIFRAESSEMASNLMDSDPAIAHGLMTGELHPFRVSHFSTVTENS